MVRLVLFILKGLLPSSGFWQSSQVDLAVGRAHFLVSKRAGVHPRTAPGFLGRNDFEEIVNILCTGQANPVVVSMRGRWGPVHAGCKDGSHCRGPLEAHHPRSKGWVFTCPGSCGEPAE